MLERTVAVIKPGAVKRGDLLNILGSVFPEFKVVDMRLLQLNRFQAEVFYGEHRGKDFFEDVVSHAISGPCVGLLLEAEDAIQKWRNLIGPADRTKQSFGNLRHWFSEGNGADNAVHGSDSSVAASVEAAILGLDDTENGFGALPDEEVPADVTREEEIVPLAKFVRLDPEAVLPKRAHEEEPGYEDVGFDLTSVEEVFLAARGSVKKVRTGWRVQPPRGYELQVRTRSGLGSKGIVVANSPGTIDPNFSGELFVLLANIGNSEHTVKKGDRIAQLVFRRLDPGACVEVEELNESTSRGQAGYGSSGR